MLKRLCALVIAGATLAACSESSPPTGVIPVVNDANQSILAQLSCRVDAAASTLSCAPAGPASASGRSNDLILGGQNVYVKLTSTNVVTTPTVSVTADVTVKNLTGQPWNTGDGTTVDTAGVKVFFVNLPTNGVVISNPTDSAVFTASPKQPYFKYSGTTLLGADQILSAGETSGVINWNFQLNGATSFTFGVLIVAKMPDETGTLRWVRDTTSKTTSGGYLVSAWGASATDVWAGGAGAGTASGATALQHWDGASWTPYTWNGGDVNGLWGTSSSNIYGAASGNIIHWNGASWSAEAYAPAASLVTIWGSSATDIYAGGQSGTLAHYDGVSWSTVSGTGIAAGELVTAIWGTSSSNVYVATASATVGLGLHRWNGTSWSTVNAGDPRIRSIWGSSSTDIYVGGDFGFVAHWNGASWSTISGFGTTANDGIQGIWGSSSSSIYLVTAGGTIWHSADSGVHWFSLPNSGIRLIAVWGSSRNVFAVGYPVSAPYYGIVMRGMR
jgi:hypothetical protein